MLHRLVLCRIVKNVSYIPDHYCYLQISNLEYRSYVNLKFDKRCKVRFIQILASLRFTWIAWHYLRVETSDSRLVGLALDAERGLLYYTDSIQGIIAEITTSGTNRRVIFSDRNKQPQAIVVDSISR